MASSRIFVKGLPPTLGEAEFKKHFSQNREITDAKIFPNRRIGYVGYKTPEDAQKAVKYFNRTFIRMSKIGVELARPPQERKVEEVGPAAPTARRPSGNDRGPQKKADEGENAGNSKLEEFLNVMRPKSKKRAREEDGPDGTRQHHEPDVQIQPNVIVEDPSDDEYETAPRQIKKPQMDEEPSKELLGTSSASDEPPEEEYDKGEGQAAIEGDSNIVQSPADHTPVSDVDWARSRTSRLLGLLDDDEEEQPAAKPGSNDAPSDSDDVDLVEGTSKDMPNGATESSIPTPPSDHTADESKPHGNSEVEGIRSSMRLFVRNLPYTVSEQDLEAVFETYGHLEGVSSVIPLFTT
jgi:multiple RNA-binding domain-containing protein 1